MKVQIVSDLHIDENIHTDIRTLVRNDQDAELLLVAGDTAHGYAHRDWNNAPGVGKAVRAFEKYAKANWRETVFGHGNHDFYHQGLPEQPGRVVEACGLKILTTPLYSKVTAPESKCKGWVDLRWTKGRDGNALTAAGYDAMHLQCKEWLDSELAKSDGKVVVMTHHLPLHELVSEHWRGYDSNFWFASDLSALVDKHAAKIALWVHGHSHDRVDAAHHGVRFVRNPVGYLRYGEGARHSSMVVEV